MAFPDGWHNGRISSGCAKRFPELCCEKRSRRARTPLRSSRGTSRSEEHTSELQSQFHLVCRLLLEKKNHPTVNTTGYIHHAAFLGTINPDTNKIPKHLFQGYLNIYNNYFKAPWLPDRTEANPNELNPDDARYFFCFFRRPPISTLFPYTTLFRSRSSRGTS